MLDINLKGAFFFAQAAAEFTGPKMTDDRSLEVRDGVRRRAVRRSLPLSSRSVGETSAGANAVAAGRRPTTCRTWSSAAPPSANAAHLAAAFGALGRRFRA